MVPCRVARHRQAERTSALEEGKEESSLWRAGVAQDAEQVAKGTEKKRSNGKGVGRRGRRIRGLTIAPAGERARGGGGEGASAAVQGLQRAHVGRPQAKPVVTTRIQTTGSVEGCRHIATGERSWGACGPVSSPDGVRLLAPPLQKQGRERPLPSRSCRSCGDGGGRLNTCFPPFSLDFPLHMTGATACTPKTEHLTIAARAQQGCCEIRHRRVTFWGGRGWLRRYRVCTPPPPTRFTR